VLNHALLDQTLRGCSVKSEIEFTNQENQAERIHVAVRDECCSSGDAYPRPRAGSARGRCVRFWYTNTVHLDLPTPLQFLL